MLGGVGTMELPRPSVVRLDLGSLQNSLAFLWSGCGKCLLLHSQKNPGDRDCRASQENSI